MLSSIRSLLFGIRLILVVLSYLLSLVNHVRIRRLLLSFVACMTFGLDLMISLSLSVLSRLLVTLMFH
jgi:hypothetical protein